MLRETAQGPGSEDNPGREVLGNANPILDRFRKGEAPAEPTPLDNRLQTGLSKKASRQLPFSAGTSPCQKNTHRRKTWPWPAGFQNKAAEWAWEKIGPLRCGHIDLP